jgi:hypothetical protein
VSFAYRRRRELGLRRGKKALLPMFGSAHTGRKGKTHGLCSGAMKRFRRG